MIFHDCFIFLHIHEVLKCSFFFQANMAELYLTVSVYDSLFLFLEHNVTLHITQDNSDELNMKSKYSIS